MPLTNRKQYDVLLTTFGRQDELAQPIPEHLSERIDEFFRIYSSVAPNLSGKEREFFMLNEYLKIANLSMSDEVMDEIAKRDDNIIEIYGFDYAQLFRSASFLKFRTYTLATLMTKSNFELYEREDEHVPAIQAQIGEALQHRKLIKFDVPAHKVWEKAEGARTDYHWMMKLGICAPVMATGSSEPTAFVVTHNTIQVFKSPFSRPTLEIVKNP